MSDFSKTLRKRLGRKPQPKPQNEVDEDIGDKEERVSWILENYGKWIRQIIEVTAEYKAKYGVPEGETVEEIKDYEEERLWRKHHALIDYVRDAFMKEYSCSEETALKYVFMAIQQQTSRLSILNS